jgi:hypothetical protein
MGDNAAEDKALAESAQMSKLFRVMAIAQANVMNRVMRNEATAAKIHQADAEARQLIKHANLVGNHKCPEGMIWDESQKRCVPA